MDVPHEAVLLSNSIYSFSTKSGSLDIELINDPCLTSTNIQMEYRLPTSATNPIPLRLSFPYSDNILPH